jgi:hypothetical protein
MLTFRDYGISWDEESQSIYGKLLLRFYGSGLRDHAAFQFINLRYYGGAFDMLAALCERVLPFDTYETRHLLGGLVGILGCVGVWRLTRLLAGERAARFAMVLAVLTPLLYGHNFINPKDAPLAWALLWTTYYYCRVLGEFPSPHWRSVLGFGLAFGLTLGTRVTGVVIIAYGMMGLCIRAVGQRHEGKEWRSVARETLSFVERLLPALALAGSLMAILWPWSVLSLKNSAIVLKRFLNFGIDGEVLFNGQLYRPDLIPATYPFVLLTIQLPEMVLVGLLVAFVSTLGTVRRDGLGFLCTPRGLQWSLVVAGAVGPLIAFLVFRPHLYNGVRHLLFVVPPLMIIAGVAWARMHAAAGGWGRAVVVVFVLACGLQVMALRELHPNEYVYYNRLVGGVAGASGRFELDYWGTSLAELARNLDRLVLSRGVSASVPLRVYTCGDSLSASHFFTERLQSVMDLPRAEFMLRIKSPDCEARAPGLTEVLQVRRGGAVLSSGAWLTRSWGPDPRESGANEGAQSASPDRVAADSAHSAGAGARSVGRRVPRARHGG